MDKQLLTDLVNNNKSIREIALHFNKGKTTIRYWLKKYNLETNVPHQNFNITEKICTKCKILKPIDEYYFKNKTHTCRQAECKTCFNTRITKQFKDLKSECVNYKGGCCERCGYNRYQGALEFHHQDPKEKDFAISNATSRKLTDKIKKELDKCILVCANCHREIHHELGQE